jgi:glycosyltransferase involved in cell wall biosynthesis
MSCLRGAGVEVTERHVPVWETREHKWELGALSAVRLAAAEAQLLVSRPQGDVDVVLVGYPGHLDLVAARRAARGRPLVFNPLVSLSDTFVEDRGRFRPGSVSARLVTRIDRHAFSAADVVVADTAAHAQRFRELGARRVEVCFVGAEERVFTPGWTAPQRFTCLFVGKLIPLHGLDTILAAARIAPEVPVRVVGSGQLQPLLTNRPANVEWVPWVDYEDLPGELHRAGCALGIFAASPKAQRVIPNKVFQALACGTPVITADTPAARELLMDGESALLVPPGDARALAGAIRRLAQDPELTRRLAEGGQAAYRAHASEAILGARWRDLLASLR